MPNGKLYIEFTDDELSSYSAYLLSRAAQCRQYGDVNLYNETIQHLSWLTDEQMRRVRMRRANPPMEMPPYLYEYLMASNLRDPVESERLMDYWQKEMDRVIDERQ